MIGETLEIPPFVKDEMRKHLAFMRLIEAAEAVLDDNVACAATSYTPHPYADFTDKLWRKEDPVHAKICIELRRALKEAIRVTGFRRVSGDGQ